MLRYRRYRVFVVFAVFAVVGFYYHFASNSGWHPATAISVGSLGNFGLSQTDNKPAPADVPVALDNRKSDVLDELVQAPLVNAAPVQTTQATLLDVLLPLAAKSTSVTTKSATTPIEAQVAVPATAKPGHNVPGDNILADGEVREGGQGRVEVTATVRPTTIHWSQQPEHFPVSSTIALPTGEATTIPRIQHKFDKETTAQKEERLAKLKVIKDAAVFSWQGYKDHAWKHDEVLPDSGGKRDPFCGWAATLVDALDTLWIMGMKDEFEEAVKAVSEIDFTTSPRKDIPLFETTIRYLGGMLAAYDVSGGTYEPLLNKSVELADVLMGAFDTPNRMPMTFYHWMPTFASQPHRAMTRVVLAEIGSLSVEFTRLAQLTKEDRYYDAIARITDAFEEWQSREKNGTMLPGLFPTYVDASGCEKPAQIKSTGKTWNVRPQNPLVGDGRETLTGDGAPPSVGSNPEKAIPFSGDRSNTPQSAPAAAVAADPAGAVSAVGSNPEKAIPVSGDRPKKPEGAAAAGEPASLAVGSQQQQSNSQGSTQAFQVGRPGSGKIAGWGNPIKEGDLDSPENKEKLLAGKASEIGSAKDVGSKQQQSSPDASTEVFQVGRPGSGKIAGWGNPIKEGDLDSQENKEKLLAGKANDIGSTKEKRQLGGELGEKTHDGSSASLNKNPHMPATQAKSPPQEKKAGSSGKHPQGLDVCIQTGLSSTGKSGADKFTLGGMADSIYEYLPKEYILLGGLEDKYRTMYEKAMDTATEYLVYRPMTPMNDDILFAGEWRTHMNKAGDSVGQLHPEGAHLTCFAGGMYALGAKIFNRPEDLEIGRKLTQGCVWAYANTASGIMPEMMELLPCKSKTNCPWDEELYYSALDPNQATRTKVHVPPAARATATSTQTKEVVFNPADDILAAKAPTPAVAKRQVPAQDAPKPQIESPSKVTLNDPKTIPQAKPGNRGSANSGSKNYTPKPPLSHKEYVQARIRDERLPGGVTRITARKYILRPEAIESVWYMYRITGEEHWRKVGWEMFEAVNEHTRATFGYSAIDDVTKTVPRLLDEEESFWLAETLKYFYLLFSEESVISLDDWVLNTEAHPFKRPDYQG